MGIANVILLTTVPFTRGGLPSLMTYVMRASFSVIGSRLMLNLRGVFFASQADAIDTVSVMVVIPGSDTLITETTITSIVNISN